MYGSIPARSSIDAAEVARFSAIADQWWDPRGKFAPLHRLNPVRLAFIRERALAWFERPDGERRPFAGLRLLDIGCGGGLLCEPMARLGFAVAGADASEANIVAARAHAEERGHSILYRRATAEDLIAEAQQRWDVVLAMEVVEHVAAPADFLRDCMRLVAPGGLFVLSTLNRTVRSLLLGKIAAEYLLRWVPRGTHDWRRFVNPEEIRAMVTPLGEPFGDPVGVRFDPISGRWRETTDLAVNFMLAFVAMPRAGASVAGEQQCEINAPLNAA